MNAVNTMNADQLVEAVQQWAADRGFATGATIEGQTCKFYEELGEFFTRYNRKQCVKDDLGDMLVVAIVLGYVAKAQGSRSASPELFAEQFRDAYYSDGSKSVLFLVSRISYLLFANEFLTLFYRVCCLAHCVGHDPLECLQLAYDEIKDRKGKMIDGKFVKEADLEKVPT